MDTDLDLLQRYTRTRDAQAFAELAQRYAPMVYATCLRVTGNRADAEDAAQETLLQLARTPEAVESNLGGWLYRTARNRAADQVRSAATRRKYEEAVAPQRPAEQADAAGVDEVVGSLGDDLREPLVLHFWRGLSQEQVAAELAISQPTVSRRIAEAIELLRSRLQSDGITTAPAVLLASSEFTGDAGVAGVVAERVATVVGSVHTASTSASAATVSLSIKLVAAGLLLTGAGIAAVGIGKGQAPVAATQPVPAAAVQAAVPIADWKTDGMKVTIEGMGSVELVGICTDETDPPTWWGPDGKMLENGPFTSSSIQKLPLWQDKVRRRFAAQMTGVAGTRMYFWGFDGAQGSRWTGNPPMAGIFPRLDIREAEAAFPDGLATTTVRYGIASAKLDTLLEADPRGNRLSGDERVRMASVRPQGDRTITRFTVQEALDAQGVVTSFAVTTTGRWLERNDSNRNPQSGRVDYDHTFNLPQDQIQKFVIQSRHYTHWITYTNVPLRPGVATATVSVEQAAK